MADRLANPKQMFENVFWEYFRFGSNPWLLIPSIPISAAINFALGYSLISAIIGAVVGCTVWYGITLLILRFDPKKQKEPKDKVIQSNNIVYGDMAGRDINK